MKLDTAIFLLSSNILEFKLIETLHVNLKNLNSNMPFDDVLTKMQSNPSNAYLPFDVEWYKPLCEAIKQVYRPYSPSYKRYSNPMNVFVNKMLEKLTGNKNFYFNTKLNLDNFAPGELEKAHMVWVTKFVSNYKSLLENKKFDRSVASLSVVPDFMQISNTTLVEIYDLVAADKTPVPRFFDSVIMYYESRSQTQLSDTEHMPIWLAEIKE